MNETPCRNCTQRFVGCHITCESYKDYKIKHEIEKAERDKQKHEHLNANDFKFEGMKRMQRGKR